MSARVYGLTGGIASGKSTAARIFGEFGVPTVDADQVARSLSQPGGRAHDAIVARFGTADRARLREIVFKDSKARKDLEAILHPLIREESLARIATASAPVVLYEAALLVETGRHAEFDGLIVVEAPLEARVARVMARDGSTRGQAEAMIRAQLPDEARRAAATHVLVNDGSEDVLRARISALLPLLS